MNFYLNLPNPKNILYDPNSLHPFMLSMMSKHDNGVMFLSSHARLSHSKMCFSIAHLLTEDME